MSRWFSARAVILLAWIAIVLVFGAAAGSLSFNLVNSVLVNMVPLLLLALAAGIVISCGEIDISLGGVLSVGGMLTVYLLAVLPTAEGMFWAVTCIAMLLIFLYYFSFSVLVNIGVPSLIFSIGALLVTRGLSTLIQSCMQGVGEICRANADSERLPTVLDRSYVIGWLDGLGPSLFLIFLVVGLLALFRYRSIFGIEHLAVGMDRKAALFARISVQSVRLRAFFIAAALVSLAVFVRLHGQNNGGWSANTGWGEEILAIAIAVIGGTKIIGGRFEPFTILLATIAVYFTRDVVTNDLNVPTEVASIIFGAALVVIVAVDGAAQHRPTIRQRALRSIAEQS